MSDVYDQQNLAESREQLVSFITKAIADAPKQVVRLTNRVALLGSARRVAGEMVRILEQSDGNRHEFELDNTDLVLHLSIDDSGFIEGKIADKPEVSEVAILLTGILLDYGLAD